MSGVEAILFVLESSFDIDREDKYHNQCRREKQMEQCVSYARSASVNKARVTLKKGKTFRIHVLVHNGAYKRILVTVR